MSKESKKIILLGPQGSGKSTQGEVITEYFDIPSVSSGNILRQAIADDTPLGRKVAPTVNKGNLISDQDMIEVILEELKKDKYENGFLLDGFPRNIYQAEALAKHYTIDKVFNIEIADETAIERISGRRICPEGHTWHIEYEKPQEAGICDICNGNLTQRADDQEEVVKKRLAIYREKTAELLDYYKDRLVIIDGEPPIEVVKRSVLDYLENNNVR